MNIKSFINDFRLIKKRNKTINLLQKTKDSQLLKHYSTHSDDYFRLLVAQNKAAPLSSLINLAEVHNQNYIKFWKGVSATRTIRAASITTRRYLPKGKELIVQAAMNNPALLLEAMRPIDFEKIKGFNISLENRMTEEEKTVYFELRKNFKGTVGELLDIMNTVRK